MDMFAEISAALQKGKAKDTVALTEAALAEGIAASDILEKALIPAMGEVGVRFKNGEMFVPEVLVAARAMNMALKILRPVLQSAGVEPIGRAVICTVKGDMHDIGKNLVKMMIEGQGIECIDLGVDVPAERVVEAVRETGTPLLCLSALLTTTMDGQREVIEALKAAGLRDQVKIMVGGVPITPEFAAEIGADCYTPDATAAATAARAFFA